jgi:hypothetical protein
MQKGGGIADALHQILHRILWNMRIQKNKSEADPIDSDVPKAEQNIKVLVYTSEVKIPTDQVIVC